ncbi:amidohydrolase family protein [Microscilla marina]|uniref:Amidohydrolase family protein n=1 Tax=Microscilla marina ATCC 23134 TaxID=313606 RepID=A1ZS58_MICM2|nr:amidohydrolase family protein [Microscilla marina]EAY26781.1 amidohydrolase family protein [Microscilla marina ATCC 23134]
MQKTLFLLFTLWWVFGVSHAQKPDTTRWSVTMGTKQVGFLKKWKNVDGTFSEWFQFNDRGRGDSTVGTYSYDKDGYITMIDARGVDYYKKPVYERYGFKREEAFWENNVEKGKEGVRRKAQYVALNISLGTSYQAYFNNPKRIIQHLPSGSSTLKVLQNHILRDGRKVKLVRISGLGLAPKYIWLNKNNEFFAAPGEWFSMVKLGYEGFTKELHKITKMYRDSYYKELASQLRHKISKGLLITNAQVFDPVAGKLYPKSSILIAKSKIQQVAYGKKLKAPEGYQKINARGKFAMPGLWDMHVHYTSETDGLLHLACGVTNVRDMGNSEALLARKKAIEAGTVLGPRIQAMAGFIDGAGKYAGPIGSKVHNVKEGVAAVQAYASKGYQQIKLYSSLKPAWVKPLAEEAHRLKMRVSGHIPSFMLAEEAVKAGYNEIQHANMLFLNFYGKKLDTRTPVRFSAVAQRGHQFDFDSPQFKAFVQLLKQKNVVIDPTVTIFENMFVGTKGEFRPSMKRVAKRLPLNIQRSMQAGSSLEVPEGQGANYEKSFANMLKMVKVMHQNNITVVPGTDSFVGFTLHRELENYVKAGIPAAEVLKMATITSAKVAGRATKYGTIAKGKAADIILISGNPLKNIADVGKVAITIKNQDIYYTKELFKAVSVKYF